MCQLLTTFTKLTLLAAATTTVATVAHADDYSYKKLNDNQRLELVKKYETSNPKLIELTKLYLAELDKIMEKKTVPYQDLRNHVLLFAGRLSEDKVTFNSDVTFPVVDAWVDYVQSCTLLFKNKVISSPSNSKDLCLAGILAGTSGIPMSYYGSYAAYVIFSQKGYDIKRIYSDVLAKPAFKQGKYSLSAFRYADWKSDGVISLLEKQYKVKIAN